MHQSLTLSNNVYTASFLDKILIKEFYLVFSAVFIRLDEPSKRNLC